MGDGSDIARSSGVLLARHEQFAPDPVEVDVSSLPYAIAEARALSNMSCRIWVGRGDPTSGKPPAYAELALCPRGSRPPSDDGLPRAIPLEHHQPANIVCEIRPPGDVC
jgi:hypothetical protein